MKPQTIILLVVIACLVLTNICTLNWLGDSEELFNKSQELSQDNLDLAEKINGELGDCADLTTQAVDGWKGCLNELEQLK